MDTTRIAIQAPGALDEATERLQRGEILAFPTDTVYGVGAHAFLPDAVHKLYEIKERPAHLPIPLLLPGAGALSSVCADVPPLAWQLAERFWPGGLTLVLRRAALVPDVVTAGGPTVAVRVPDQPFVRELSRRLGAPLAATSANRHGQPPPITPGEAWAQLAGQIALLLDGGPCPGGRPSTLLDLTVSPPRILRPGPITVEQLRATGVPITPTSP
jgi:L-threonylcarbamoyladenylate synthase